jgi:hypothetical protein
MGKFFLVLGAVFLLISQAQAGDLTGDAGVAEKYAAWAEKAIGEGRWQEALIALERAGDFSDVSSDLSYLLARARFHENKPKGAVLEAVRRALEANRWKRYGVPEGRLLEAETLISIRAFSEALNALALLSPDAESARLRLLCLKGLSRSGEFLRFMAETLERYPRDPRPVRILFERFQLDYVPEAPGNRSGGESPADLIALALRRLPLLLDADPELAYLAVPFIRDKGEASRLVASYRVLAQNPASIPSALGLGLIDEREAVDEIFAPRIRSVDRALLLEVWKLLRHDEGRTLFRRNLSRFSGVITEDADRDGYTEILSRFLNGVAEEYSYDADQDGLPELAVFLDVGVPVRAELASLPEAPFPARPETVRNLVGGTGETGGPGDGPFAHPVKDEDRVKIFFRWEQFPAALDAELRGVRYVFRPFEFFFSPARFRELAGSGLLYLERDSLGTRISRRTLVSFSAYLERPSAEFKGALERIHLDRGIPRQAREFLDGRLISATEFVGGRPLIQRIDLDLDGRMETVRYFKKDISVPEPSEDADPLNYEKILEFSESDWDGDGIFEIRESFIPQEGGKEGRVIRSWDFDGDGIREYSR